MQRTKVYGQTQNFNKVILAAMEDYARRTCLKVRRGGRYHDISYKYLQNLSFRIASFLINNGVSLGDRVVLIADNSPEWLASFFATLLTGGVIVPLSPNQRTDKLHLMVKDCGAKVVVLQDIEQIAILKGSGEALGDIKIIFINEPNGNLPNATLLKNILEESISTSEVDKVRTIAESVVPEASATILYTAKETDSPRGAVFDHFQCLLSILHMAKWFALEDDDMAFTVNNWSYVPSLKAALYFFVSGIPNVLSEGTDTIFENMQQTSPTVLLTIPFTLENIYYHVMNEVNQLPGSSRKVFQWAISTGKEYISAGVTASCELVERYKKADLTFFSQIRGKLGGRLRRVYIVGAPLPNNLAEFAQTIGLNTSNVYAITESGGFPAVSSVGVERAGSCGQVAPGFQISISDDGEVLVRGGTTTRSYITNISIDIIDSEGWLHTGDIGRFDSDGYLYLTGYRQSLIKLSKGLKIMPNIIENYLTINDLISQAAVFGDGRPYVSALIVPNMEEVLAHLKEGGEGVEGTSISVSNPKVKTLLDSVIADVNSKLSSWERIEAYTILENPFSEKTGELTVSKKINRQVVAERYSTYINAMYPMSIQIEDRAVTEVQLQPEQLHELLEKQDILDAWIKDAGIGFLFELARSKQIDIPSMVHICDTVAAIAQMQTEEKPLSTALIVGDPARIARVLPESEIQLQRYDHIRRMRQVVITLARLVDGLILAYGVDKHGYVRKIHKIEKQIEESDSFLLGPQFRHHAAISKQCDAVVFFVPIGGRQARVFANGQMMGRYSNGIWSSESLPYMEGALSRLAEQRKIEIKLLQRIMRCAFQMSEENLGAIFVLGEAETIFRLSDPPEFSSFVTMLNADLNRLSDRELISYAKQDGATIIDTQNGMFRGCMVLLRPKADTRAEIGMGKGARHSSAAKMSYEAKCLAITVSQDGPITVYDNGNKILSL